MKSTGTKKLKDYPMVYSGVNSTKRAQCGIAILLDNKWVNKIQSYTYVNDRMITFYKEFQQQVNRIAKSDYLTIIGDLKARIGNTAEPGIVETYRENTLNCNGHELRHFAAYNELKW